MPDVTRGRFGWMTIAIVFTVLLAGAYAVPIANAAAPDEDGITVPDGTPEELAKFINQTRRKRVRSLAEYRQKYEAVLKASDKILAAKSAEEKYTLTAIQAKLSALGFLRRLARNPTARLKRGKELRSFAEELKKDKRKDIQTQGEATLISLDAAEIPKMTADGLKKISARVVSFLKGGDYATTNMDASRRFSAAISVARSMEYANKTEPAIALYKQLGAALDSAKAERWVHYKDMMQGSVRRLMLPGNPIVLNGRTTDGKPFDWKDYKGKVVLVDFWATWCGPCVAELPNVKKNYARYHSKGFEVVGINMDTNRNRLDKFLEDRKIPWVNLIDPDKKKQGWNHPIATYYGIMAIPSTILVDQKGNVVSLKARGPELGMQLRKLLGSPAEEKDDTK